MSSLLVIGDSHLNKGTSLGKSVVGSNLNSRILDQINLLEWSLDRAIQNHVTDIALTGDVFDDPKPPTALVTIFISWLNKCRLHNINVHIVVGNHDTLRSGSVYNSPLDIVEECNIEGVYVYRQINTCIFDGFAVTFVPFKDRKSFAKTSNAEAMTVLKNQFTYEQASIPSTYKKIMVGHLAIEGSIPIGDEIDDLANELMCPLTIFEGYDYVWMGHIHKQQVMNKNPHIAHIGSMDISDFGEVGQEKKIVIFSLDLPNNFIYETLPTRSLDKIIVDVPENEENPTKFVIDLINEKKLNSSIVKLEVNLLDKSRTINKVEIEKKLLSRGAFNVASIVESKKTSSLKKEENKINSKMDVISAIKQYADSYIQDCEKSDFIEAASKIYNQYQEET